MRRFLGCMFFVIVSQAFAQEASLQFDQANELYRTGKFDKAVESYEQILHSGYDDPALYYNLGNAYFKLGKFPAAILNYERAKRLAPHDEDVAYNLHLANLRIIDRIEPIPQLFLLEWWQMVVNLAPSHQWAVFIVIMTWIMVVCATLFWLVRSQVFQKIMFFAGLLVLAGTIVGYVAMIQQMGKERNDQAAIVFSPSVTVKSSPDEMSTDLFILHEGVKLELLDAVSYWRKIRLPDGKIGWLPVKDMQVI